MKFPLHMPPTKLSSKAFVSHIVAIAHLVVFSFGAIALFPISIMDFNKITPNPNSQNKLTHSPKTPIAKPVQNIDKK